MEGRVKEGGMEGGWEGGRKGGWSMGSGCLGMGWESGCLVVSRGRVDCHGYDREDHVGVGHWGGGGGFG